MIEYFPKPNVKTAFSKAIVKFCTTNQLFKFHYVGYFRSVLH